MAIVTKHALAAKLTPVLEVGISPLNRSIAIASADAASGDVIELATLPRAGKIDLAFLSTSATLGSGCTVQLVVGDGTTNVAVTGATSAGSAQKVNSTANGVVEFVAGAKLYLLVGGGNVSAAATAKVTALIEYN